VALGEEGMADLRPWFRPVFPVLWAIVGLGLGGMLLVLPPTIGTLLGLPEVFNAPALYAGGIAAAVAIVAVWQVFWRDRLRLGPTSALVAVLTGLLVLAPGLAGVLPRLDAIWLSRSAELLVSLQRKPGERVGSTGYTEASLVFQLGTDTALVSPEALVADLADRSVALALVEGREDEKFRAAAAARQLRLHPYGSVQGLDYSNGKKMVLILYRAETP